MNDPLLDGILSLKFEVLELRSHVNKMESLYGKSTLTEVFTSKINDTLEDIEYLERVYQVTTRSSISTQSQYKTLEETLTIIKYRRHILAIFLEALNQHLTVVNQVGEKETIKIIDNIVNELTSLVSSHLSNQYKVRLLYSSEYKMTYLLADKGIFLVAMPIYDFKLPWYWTLITHEMGHAFYFLKGKEIAKRIRPFLVKYLAEKAPESVKRQGIVSYYIEAWMDSWLSEFISDLFGCSLMGASFTVPFISYLQRSNVLSVEDTHPPLEARVVVQLRYMEEVSRDMYDICKEYWDALSNVKESGGELRYPFDYEILECVVKVFRELIPHPPIAKISDKILEVKNVLDSGIVKCNDPLVTICGLAISERKLELKDEVLKAIVEAL